MTDQTPATEAGRRDALIERLYDIFASDVVLEAAVEEAVLAIEAEARADVEGELALCRRAEDALQQTASILLAKVETARADALQEAADQAAPLLHPDDGHEHRWGCRLCGVDRPPWATAEARASLDVDVLARAILRIPISEIDTWASDLVRGDDEDAVLFGQAIAAEYRAILAEQKP